MRTKMSIQKMSIAMSLLAVWGTTAVLAAQQAPAPLAAAHSETYKNSAISRMVGKQVLGKSNELLGTILSFSEVDRTAEMKAPDGAIVNIPTDKLTVEGDHLKAASMSRGDVLA